MADYREARMNDVDHCPVPGCDGRIPREYAFCVKHWYQVPAHMRRAIYAAVESKDHDKRFELLDQALEQLTPRPSQELEP